MLLNYCGKEENKVSLEQMREEVLAMLKVCFEGEAAEEGERIRLILPGREKPFPYMSVKIERFLFGRRILLELIAAKTKRAIDK